MKISIENTTNLYQVLAEAYSKIITSNIDKTSDDVYRFELELSLYVKYKISQLTLILTFLQTLINLNMDIHILLILTGKDIIKNPIEKEVLEKLVYYKNVYFLDALHEMGIRTNLDIDTIYLLCENNSEQIENKDSNDSIVLGLELLQNKEEDSFKRRQKLDDLNTFLNRKLGDNKNKNKGIQLVFELVKNIYQHAYIQEPYFTGMKGFVSAEVVDGKLEISINDCGIGIVNAVKAYDSKIESSDKFMIFNHAIRTCFSSKNPDNKNDSMFKEISLVDRGYGYEFCLNCVYKSKGTMEIRDGQLKVVFTSKLVNQDIFGYFDFYEISKNGQFENYFTIHEYEEKKSALPGVQVLLKIPTD